VALLALCEEAMIKTIKWMGVVTLCVISLCVNILIFDWLVGPRWHLHEPAENTGPVNDRVMTTLDDVT
jgi:hypothetical protein